MIRPFSFEGAIEIVGSDGQHVGTVDRLVGERIRLAERRESTPDERRYIGLDMVASATIRITLNVPAAVATGAQHWLSHASDPGSPAARRSTVRES